MANTLYSGQFFPGFRTVSNASYRHSDFASPKRAARSRPRWVRWAAVSLVGANAAALGMVLWPDPESSDVATDGVREIRELSLPGIAKPSEAVAEAPGAPGAPGAPATVSAASTADETAPNESVTARVVESTEAAETAPEPPPISWANATVKKGDTLAAIFDRHGLGPAVVHKVVNSSDLAKGLSRIRPGQTLRLHIEDGELLALVHEHDRISGLRIDRAGEGFRAEEFLTPVDKRVTSASAVIDDSLYQSAQNAGLSDRVIVQLADIFGYDIDFGLDIREGDNYTVMFEEEFLDGEKYRDGEIIAAEFVNQGRTIRAYRFVDDEGVSRYYSPDGHSMRKAFLRSPMEFARISSRFTKRRWHPILKKWRAHKGVDYAAPKGTPIRSTGEGRIARIGTIGGYGKAVMIQHGETYTTVYGHMSRFARGMKKGARVRQGQVIGYVGQTGYATGPHLHYEFRVNGVHKNPLTVKLPMAEPIPARYADRFKEEAKILSAQLDQYRRVVVAQAE